eukprot:scaffold895_cov315-Pinguiococcus_pyrenoidosus.AAC.12
MPPPPPGERPQGWLACPPRPSARERCPLRSSAGVPSPDAGRSQALVRSRMGALEHRWRAVDLEHSCAAEGAPTHLLVVRFSPFPDLRGALSSLGSIWLDLEAGKGHQNVVQVSLVEHKKVAIHQRDDVRGAAGVLHEQSDLAEVVARQERLDHANALHLDVHRALMKKVHALPDVPGLRDAVAGQTALRLQRHHDGPPKGLLSIGEQVAAGHHVGAHRHLELPLHPHRKELKNHVHSGAVRLLGRVVQVAIEPVLHLFARRGLALAKEGSQEKDLLKVLPSACV